MSGKQAHACVRQIRSPGSTVADASEVIFIDSGHCLGFCKYELEYSLSRLLWCVVSMRKITTMTIQSIQYSSATQDAGLGRKRQQCPLFHSAQRLPTSN